MNDGPSTLRLWLVRVLVPAALIIGVGWFTVGRPPAVDEPSGDSSAERLHKIGLAINEATARLGRPPANFAELRPYLKEHGNPDQILVSPTDRQPFVLLWGVDVRSAGYGTVLGYERHGSGGRRFVLTASSVLQLTEEELGRADFPPGFRPPETN